MKKVKANGPKDAKIVIIGEAPGRDEEITGIPFVGSSGKLLNRLLKSSGIQRQDCYITNVVKYRPPDNKVDRIGEIGLTMDMCVQELKTELEELNPNVVIALGNIPLHALTSKGGLNTKSQWTGITKYRGSILKSTLIPNLKVIPTIHPAAALRQYVVTALMMADFSRAKKESEFNDFRNLPTYEYKIGTVYEEVIQELDRMLNEAKFISLDLETNMGANYIKCIGLADGDSSGLCIPLVDGKKIYWSVEEEIEIWKRVKVLLTDKKYYKIIQNTPFEYQCLFPWVGEIFPIFMDTMVAQKLCYPELKKGLDTIASLYTYQPYYKDDVKEKGAWSEGEDLWKYNIIDICVTFKAAMKLEKELKDLGLHEFFHGYVMPLQRVMTKATQIGLKVDEEKLKEYYDTATRKCMKFQNALDKLVGYHLNVKSTPQMRKYLYKELNLVPIKLKAGVAMTDEEALTRMAYKNPSHLAILSLIMDIVKMRTLISTYLGGRKDKDANIWSYDRCILLDSDSRIRSTFIVGGTETGRQSARKTMQGQGCNLQNQPKYIRDMYVADDSETFIVGDLSQVEARDVAFLSGDLGLKTIFKSGKDIHREVASWVHQIPAHEVTIAQRNVCKHVVHGANYDIGARAFTFKLNEPREDGAWLREQKNNDSVGPKGILDRGQTKEKEGKWLLERYHNAFPGVRNWHLSIQEKLGRDRTLITPFGRKRTFFGWWGDQMFKAAYATVPQGCAADRLGLAAVRIDQMIYEKGEILVQVHDELVIQVNKELSMEVAKIFKEEVEVPITFNEETFVVPVEIEIGDNWKDTKEVEI